HAYLDAMLEKSAQEAFAIDMGYNPTVKNAVVAPDLNKRIGFAPEEFEPRVMMVEAVTLANYVKFFTDPFYTNIFWTTLRVALVCTIVCLVLAFPLAYVLARSESRYKNVLVMLVVLPLFVGNAVRAAGWMTLFGSKGALNAGLLQLGAIDVPLQIMFTEKAVIIGIIAVNLPYMVLTLQS